MNQWWNSLSDGQKTVTGQSEWHKPNLAIHITQMSSLDCGVNVFNAVLLNKQILCFYFSVHCSIWTNLSLFQASLQRMRWCFVVGEFLLCSAPWSSTSHLTPPPVSQLICFAFIMCCIWITNLFQGQSCLHRLKMRNFVLDWKGLITLGLIYTFTYSLACFQVSLVLERVLSWISI